ncbi:hypothetical protein FRB97_002748 [Tulasnella sp. 331]|nr:hypothetical protein FRB97_002748 [Tulasnella sp. 331]
MSVSLGNEPAMRPTFSGKQDEDVAVFIHNIQRVAFAMGKQRDNDWQADYASTCLLGNAMRWYSELEDDETRYSWTLLRRALSQRFPLPVPDMAVESATASMASPSIDDAPPAYGSTVQSPDDTESVVSFTPSSLLPQLNSSSRNSWNVTEADDQFAASDLSEQRRHSAILSAAPFVPELPSWATFNYTPRKGRLRMNLACDGSFIGYVPKDVTGKSKYPGRFPQNAVDALVVSVPGLSFAHSTRWKMQIWIANAEMATLTSGAGRITDNLLQRSGP